MITEMIHGMTSDIGALLWEGLLLVDWKLGLALLLTLTIVGLAMMSSYYQGMHKGYQHAKNTLLIRTQSSRSSSDQPNFQTLDPHEEINHA